MENKCRNSKEKNSLKGYILFPELHLLQVTWHHHTWKANICRLLIVSLVPKTAVTLLETQASKQNLRPGGEGLPWGGWCVDRIRTLRTLGQHSHKHQEDVIYMFTALCNLSIYPYSEQFRTMTGSLMHCISQRKWSSSSQTMILMHTNKQAVKISLKPAAH